MIKTQFGNHILLAPRHLVYYRCTIIARMKRKVVTITGGSGFVGQMLCNGLRARGWDVRVFDQFRGPLVDFLRHRFLATSRSRKRLKLAKRLKIIMIGAEVNLIKRGLLRPSIDNILDLRSRLADRFRGSDVVIHLAGLPHEHVKGAIAADFRRINYEGTLNVFEAARDAGVPKFIFASSAQVYKINAPIHLERFPIPEANYCPKLEEGQSLYGWLKTQSEQYLAEACRSGNTQSLAMRLEMPGMLSRFYFNFYASTSIENLVSGFVCAMEAELASGFEAFNLVDAVVDKNVADIQKFLAESWPDVPNRTTGNESLLDVEKARRLLHYDPKPGGTYHDFNVIWD